MAHTQLFDFSGTRQLENLNPIPNDLATEIITPTILHLAEAIEVLAAGGYVDRHGWLWRATDPRYNAYAFCRKLRFVTYALLWRYGHIIWTTDQESAVARLKD
jgi:hypothetical protein